MEGAVIYLLDSNAWTKPKIPSEPIYKHPSENHVVGDIDLDVQHMHRTSDSESEKETAAYEDYELGIIHVEKEASLWRNSPRVG